MELKDNKKTKWAISDLIDDDKIYVFDSSKIHFETYPDLTKVESIKEDGILGTKITTYTRTILNKDKIPGTDEYIS